MSIPAAEMRAALLLAWLVLSLGLGCALGAALVLPEEPVLGLAAQCGFPGGHREPCALCGMTHAFLALRRGDPRAAVEAHAASVVLFPLLGLNEAAAVFVFLRRRGRGGAGRVSSCDAD